MATLYQLSNFSGNSQQFSEGSHDINDWERMTVSSLKVEEGFMVTLFQNPGFKGLEAEFRPGDHDFDAITSSGISNYYDSVSSLIVLKMGMYLQSYSGQLPRSSLNVGGRG